MEEKDQNDLNEVFLDGVESAPPDVNEDKPTEQLSPPKKPEKKKVLKTVLCIVGAVFLAVGAFFGGMLIGQNQPDDELNRLFRLKAAIQKYYYQEITDDEFYDVIFKAVEDGILDKYSNYLTAEELDERRKDAKGSFSGIGVVFNTSIEVTGGGLYISRIAGNSPAERAQLKADEVLLGYGVTETEITASTTFESFKTFVDGCNTGEKFYLQIRSVLGETRIVELAKEEFIENYVFYRAKSSAYAFTGANALQLTATENYLPMLDEDTACIALKQFNGGAAAQFKQAMEKFRAEGKQKLILDLRGNGGGYVSVLCDIAAYLCKDANALSPLVATARHRDGYIERFYADRNLYGQYFGENAKVYVLADENTASASECLLGCMLDYGTVSLADVCLINRNGVAKTYGKGIMQTTYYLTFVGEQDAVTLTTATIHWPKTDTCIHGVGIEKTDENDVKSVDDQNSADAELNAALSAWGI